MHFLLNMYAFGFKCNDEKVLKVDVKHRSDGRKHSIKVLSKMITYSKLDEIIYTIMVKIF